MPHWSKANGLGINANFSARYFSRSGAGNSLKGRNVNKYQMSSAAASSSMRKGRVHLGSGSTFQYGKRSSFPAGKMRKPSCSKSSTERVVSPYTLDNTLLTKASDSL